MAAYFERFQNQKFVNTFRLPTKWQTFSLNLWPWSFKVVGFTFCFLLFNIYIGSKFSRAWQDIAQWFSRHRWWWLRKYLFNDTQQKLYLWQNFLRSYPFREKEWDSRCFIWYPCCHISWHLCYVSLMSKWNFMTQTWKYIQTRTTKV